MPNFSNRQNRVRYLEKGGPPPQAGAAPTFPGPGAGGAAPSPYTPPGRSVTPPPQASMNPTFPGPGSGGAPPSPYQPPTAGGGMGGGMGQGGGVGWMGGGQDNFLHNQIGGGQGYGLPGGRIGPPEEKEGWQNPDYLNWLDSWYKSMGYNFTVPQSSANLPGANQPAPYPREEIPNPIKELPGRGGPSGGSRGGIISAPPIRGGGVGGRSNWGPMPFFPPSISGPISGSSPIMPPGTNPWDIPGARSGGSPMFPPGTNPWDIPGYRPPGEDIGARIEGDRQSIERQKKAFRDYIEAGGDPYGPNRPDLPGWSSNFAMQKRNLL